MQSSTLDISVASQLVAGIKSLLAEYRSPDYWKKVYAYAERIANSHDIPIRSSDQAKRRKRPRHLEDGVILDTVGSKDSIDSNQSASDEICCQFFYPVLDMFITEMNSRFCSQNIIIINGISSCTPGSTMFLSITDLKAFDNEYAIDVRSLDVECSLIKVAMTHCEKEISSLEAFGQYLLKCQPAYLAPWKLVQIALTIAVISAESERSFYTLKRIDETQNQNERRETF